MPSLSRTESLITLAAIGLCVSACSTSSGGSAAQVAGPGSNPLAGAIRPELAKIKHIVIIMQENRSFDHYFGTYPGADGIPMQNGVPTVCVNDPVSNVCVKPYHDALDKNSGGPHGQAQAAADINAGQMNGFIDQAEKAQTGCADPNNPACAGSTHRSTPRRPSAPRSAIPWCRSSTA